jgi:two-component system cell cycle sensor histidine kinase/response regulator CckA
MRGLFTPPVFEGDEEKTSTAQRLNAMVWFLIAMLTLYTIALPVVAPQLAYRLTLTIPLYATQIAALVCIRSGRVRLGGVLSFGGMWLTLAAAAGTAGGIRSPFFAGNILIVLGVAALFGRRVVLVLVGLSIGLGLILVWAEYAHAVPPLPATPLSALLLQSIYFVIAARTIQFATADIRKALGRARREIAERERAEAQREAAHKALREAQQMYESVFRLSPEVIVVTTEKEGRYLAASDAHERVIGYRPAEVIGHTLAEFKIWDSNAERRKVVRLLRKHEAVRNLEVRFRRRSGDPFTALLSVSPVEVGGERCLVSLATDITERKQAEDARLLLATAIDQAGESIVITDTTGAILYVNPAFERVTGYSRAEAIGQNSRLLKSGKHNRAFYEALWATITAGQVWQGRLVNRKKDGSLYTEEATISPVRDERGIIINYVAVKRDVTRELQLEEQYHQAQKMEAVGRLTAGVAHDFNNILTAINGFSEMISMELSPDDPLQDPVKKVLSSGRRAAGLVRQLLAFSRKQIVKPVVLDLNEVIANVDKMLRRIIGEDIALQTIPAPGLWLTQADPVQVEQIILNLAVNARDAMPNGGKLIIETANATLDETYAAGHLGTQPGEYVLLVVSDTGTGMTDDAKSHLFEPFFTTKELGRGTGLGLATVYGIVKQSGGDIQVYSEEGVGTAFKVYLPRAEEAAPLPVRPRVAQAIPPGDETILLVEDSAEIRDLVRQLLQKQGYTVLEAQSSQEGLRVAADFSGTIHLLLTDVVLPDASGKVLAEELSELRPGLKTLYMSGYPDNTIAHHGVLDAGIAFLQKPFNPVALARQVRAVLDAPLTER